MNSSKILIVFIIVNSLLSSVFCKTIYVAPNGTGNGSSESTPLGSFETAVSMLEPGDTMLLADGEYHQSLILNNVDGTELNPITIKSKNICGAFINADSTRTGAVSVSSCDYLILDGIKAGNAKHTVFGIGYSNNIKITRCAGFNAGYWVARDGGVVQDTYADNCHIFSIAYSSDILAEDVWAWGTGRYCFLFFQSEDCTLRRGVFRPTDTQLGYGYDRCPHSGFNLYDCDNSIAENCIAFETRIHPESTHNASDPWGLVQGGMVFDDHTLPSGFNHVYGCFDIDNGQNRTDVPRSNSAVHLMSKWSGEFEDIVIWKNAHDYSFVKTSTGTVVYPERALLGSPTRVRQNTIVESNMNHRYINGELTDIPLWPWPYETIIKEQMGMEETMTEYVTRMMEGYLIIEPVEPISVNGLAFNQDSITIEDSSTEQLLVSVMPDTATNDYLYWISSNKDIVQVDKNGLITGVTPGNAFIVAKTDDGGFSDTCYVKVEAINVTGVILDHDSISVDIGIEKQLNITFTPEDVSNKNVTWQSINKGIATVDSEGFVTGVDIGHTKIVVISEDGGYSDTCNVYVNAVSVTRIELNTDSIALEFGKFTELSATVIPENATTKFVSWASLDSDIVYVYESGLIKGVGYGTTKVVVTSVDGGYTDTCIVYVPSKDIAATSISLDFESITINVDSTYLLTAEIAPDNATNNTVVWNSSDANVANVTNTGIVTGMDVGTAEIIASTSNGLSDTCLVTVSELTDINRTNNPEVLLYPNPSGSDITINIGKNSPAKISVVDITGAIKFEKTIFNQKLTLPKGMLKTGLYFVSIQIDKSVSVIKLIVL